MMKCIINMANHKMSHQLMKDSMILIKMQPDCKSVSIAPGSQILFHFETRIGAFHIY